MSRKEIPENMALENFIKNVTHLSDESLDFLIKAKEPLNDNNKYIIYVNSKKGLESYCKKNIILPDACVRLQSMSMDFTDILDEVTSFYNDPKLKLLVITDESVIIILTAMKTLAECHVACKTCTEILNTDSQILKTRYPIFKDREKLPRLKSQIKVYNNAETPISVDEKNTILKSIRDGIGIIYETFLINVYQSLCLFINDQITFPIIKDGEGVSTLTNCTEPEAKVTSKIHFIDNEKSIMLERNNPEIMYDYVEHLVSSLNTLINKILRTLLIVRNLRFETINIDTSAINYKDIYMATPDTYAEAPLVNACAEEAKKIASKYDTLEDVFYFLSYDRSFSLPNIVVEQYNVKHTKDAEVINNFKFPNGIYRDKVSLNVFTNLILDIITRQDN